MKTLRSILFTVPFLLAGCSVVPSVTKQASFDLNCPQNQIQIVKLGADRYGAIGCGMRASYMTFCAIAGCAVLGNGSPAANATVMSAARSPIVQ